MDPTTEPQEPTIFQLAEIGRQALLAWDVSPAWWERNYSLPLVWAIVAVRGVPEHATWASHQP